MSVIEAIGTTVPQDLLELLTTNPSPVKEKKMREKTHVAAATPKPKPQSRKDLLEEIERLKAELASAQAQPAKAPRVQKSQKKWLVYDVLKERDADTANIAETLSISKECVGSYLSYLRKDGIKIDKNWKGQHRLVNKPKN